MNEDKCINKTASAINHLPKTRILRACVRMGNEVMSNARCAETGNKGALNRHLESANTH